jgi:hypothetical protein
MSGDARDFNNIEPRSVIKLFPPATQDAEGNSSQLGDFSICDAHRPGDGKIYYPVDY